MNPIFSSATGKPKAKPAALHPGDTIGIVAPGSPIQRERLEEGCKALRHLGYKPFYLESILEEEGFFAGSLERRARELEHMFEDDSVRAIICARGGYGCNYLLPELDLGKIRRHPKIFMGYSDVTSLLTYFTDQVGWVTFHGPMVTKDFDPPQGMHLPSWSAATSGAANWEAPAGRDSGVVPLVEGAAEGRLYGGCLSMLAASLGTPYEIRTEGTILFIEDVATKPFQIDRMLMQLKLAGKFEGVRGIVFGEMVNCASTPAQGTSGSAASTQELAQIVKRLVGALGVPVAYGLRSGHVSRENITLPLGVQASLKVGEKVQLTIMEAASAAGNAQSAARHSG